MSKHDVHYSSASVEWPTPQEFFDRLNEEFRFTLDVAATPDNAKCERYFTKETDGLSQSWAGEVVWCNPPYGRSIGDWMRKAYVASLAGATVVCLIPSRTDTRYFHSYILGKAEIRFVKGRLKFGDAKHAAPFPSLVAIYRPPNPEAQ